jgi:hypothetical protein
MRSPRNCEQWRMKNSRFGYRIRRIRDCTSSQFKGLRTGGRLGLAWSIEQFVSGKVTTASGSF